MEFARGINDAIRALRAVYGGVRTMLTELGDELERPPSPLYDLGVRVKPVTTRINPDERFLRTWEGRFYVMESVDGDDDDERDEDDELDDEEVDGERSQKRAVTLSAGQSVAFVKVVLYHREGDEGEPHLICGALHDAQVPARIPQLVAPRSSFRKILETVGDYTKPGKLVTKAGVRSSKGLPKQTKKTKGDHRLTFRVDHSPTRYRLFDLSGREKVREIAAELKRVMGQPPP
jgi:hypothetical protein